MRRYNWPFLIGWAIIVPLCALFWASLVITLIGCGKARAGGGYHAEAIGGPGGVRCYVVLDDQGSAVGGNCTQ